MANITFLGMGAMGSRMAKQLINSDHKVCVWNRDNRRTHALVKAGATVATSPREAVQNADFIFSMLRDDEASKSVWCDKDNGALRGMKNHAIAIECSTLSLSWVRELAQCCADKNIEFLDAPVTGSRPQADAAQLIFFVGGLKPSYEQVLPLLKIMGSTIHYAGPSGSGASIKLAVNALFGIQVASMAELIVFFKRLEMSVEEAIGILSNTPVCSPAVKFASSAMLTEIFAPMFPIALVEKDFSYAVAALGEKNRNLAMLNTAHQVFQQAIEKGFADDNITGVVQLYT